MSKAPVKDPSAAAVEYFERHLATCDECCELVTGCAVDNQVAGRADDGRGRLWALRLLGEAQAGGKNQN